MKHRVRTVLVMFLFLVGWVHAQSIALQPPSGYDNSSSTLKIIVKLFYAPGDTVILKWSPAIAADAKFVIGSSTGNYTLGEITIPANTTQKKFLPGQLNLATGRYYGLVTNSDKRTLTGIQTHANSSSTIKYSNEIQFVVEASNAPSATAPRGNVTTSTPTFQWPAIPGVPAYWIIVSSTPFTVKTVNGNPTVQGANIVWDYIATGTSATYGQISPSSPFTQSAIPLFAGQSYHYTILNLYDQNDVAYASTVFGGVVSFTYVSQATILAPNLVSPTDAQTFNATPTIRFQWDPVAGANSYTLYLFNRVTSFAGSQQEIDLPIWNGSTTNTQIDFAARQNLLKGKYVWFVVPNTSSGAGVASATRSFNYVVTLGKFRFTVSPTTSSSNLVNYSIQINSTTGGYSPSVPLIISNTEVAADSIPVDLYQFTVKKPGYNDSTYTVNISASTAINTTLKIRPFPSTVTGKVVDQAAAALRDASIQFTNILTNAVQTFTSSTSGDFSVNLPQGSYRVIVSKPGYLSPAARTYTIEQGQLDITASPFVLTLDRVTVSGTAINDEGIAIQLATVKATKGSVVQEVATNSTGNYSFELSSGSWVIEAAKSGFVSPTPITLSLVTGSSVSGKNLTLVPRANQLSGIIYRVTPTSSGNTLLPASGVTVTATPVSGAVVSAVTGSSGQFQMSLKTGTYVISTQLTGYTPSNTPQVSLSVGQTVTGIDINLNPNPSSVSGVVSTTGGSLLGDAVVTTGNITATTIPTGNYQLSLSAGTHTLRVTKAGFVTPAAVTVTLAPGQQLSGINFSMNPNASTITGSVNSLGQPLANATITAQQGSSTPIITTTGNTGEFILSVVPGSWKLVASKQGFLNSAVDSFTVGAGQTSGNHGLTLVENTAVVKGSISSNGAALNGVSILLKNKNNASISFTSQTNINGEYSLSVPAGAEYTLTASLTGYSTYNAAVATLTPRETRIVNGTVSALPASISGKVSNSQSQAMNEAKIYLINNATGIISDSTVSSVTGAYTLGTNAGTWKVRATLRGYTVDEAVVAVGLGQTLNNINLIINTNYALVSGTIKDGSTPLAGVLVSISNDDGGGTATSAADGSYAITQLVGDTYVLSVTKTGYASVLQSSFVLNGGENKSLNLNLDRLSATVSGTVKSSSGLVLADATVQISDNSNTFSAVTNASGAYSLANLAFGTYNVSAIKAGYTSPSAAPITLSSGSPSVVLDISGLVLKSSRISGKITDVTGNPLGNATLRVSGSSGSATVNSDLSGNYEFNALADGSYDLAISKQGFVTQNDVISLTGTATKSYQLDAANTTISGTVRSAAGPLGFAVSVAAISGGVNQRVNTDAQGNFSFTNMSSNAQYSLVTEIFKDGYTNDDSTFFVAKGISSYPSVALLVKVAKSKVRGGVKTGSANVSVVDTTTKQSYNVSSSSTGGFSIENLPSGVYKITPRKQGYTFAPDSRTIVLGQEATSDSLVFEATQNIGSLKVTATVAGAPRAGVRISAVSTDNDQFFGDTQSDGTITFNDVPANKDYTVAASRSGYSSTPAQNTVRVNTGAQASQSFALTANTFSLSGRLVNKNTGTGIGAAQVILRNNTVGQLVHISESSGFYTFDSLAAGEVSVSATVQGYQITPVTRVLSTATTTVDIEAVPAFVRLQGKVMFGSVGASNVIVTATSSSIYKDTTDANGNYEFAVVPIAVGATDTTTYKLSISGTDVQAQTQAVVIASSKVGTTIAVPQFTLPSGTVQLLVYNGLVPIEGVKITFITPEGNASQKVTGSNGKVTDYIKLNAGTYKVNLEADEYLIPDTTLLKFNLANNQTYSLNIPLYFGFTPLTAIDASKDTKITLRGSSTVTATANLYVKQGSAGNYQQYVMSAEGSNYSVVLPALNKTDEISYYITARATASSALYTTPVYSLKPEASGVLSSIALSPSLAGITLRKLDTYEFNVQTRDGKNNSLNSSFQGATPAGTLKLELSDSSAFEVSYPKANDLTFFRVKVLETAKDGGYRISTVGNLKGNIVRQSFDFTVGNIVLNQVVVNSNITELSNTSAGYQFTYAGVDTAKKSVTLGTGLTWTVTPTTAGTIDSTGFYKPIDNQFIGTITVTAADKLSGKKGSTDVKVYANIDKNSNITLTDKMGMRLIIVPNSVPFPIRLTLEKQQFGPGKKYYMTGSNSYIVQNTQYPIAYDADQALPNNKLSTAAEIVIPVDNSLALFEGNRVLGLYNFDKNEWGFVAGSIALSEKELSAKVTEFGEYSVLAENEDLGISKLAVLPTPFSPEVAPLKIGFKLTTKQRNASVNIRIFNMRNELVRHLIQSEQLSPNIYGSSDQGSKMEILWDGKTDDGKRALNGRYIIEVTAQDATGTVRKLQPVVLIK